MIIVWLILLLLALGAIGLALLYAAYKISIKLGRRRSLVAAGLLLVITLLAAKMLLPSKEEDFERYTGLELPSDARKLRYHTSGYDHFMDHDGVFSFVASEESLENLTEQKFRGEYSWVPLPDFRVYILNCRPRSDESVKGSIDLDAKTCHIEYSTW